MLRIRAGVAEARLGAVYSPEKPREGVWDGRPDERVMSEADEEIRKERADQAAELRIVGASTVRDRSPVTGKAGAVRRSFGSEGVVLSVATTLEAAPAQFGYAAVASMLARRVRLQAAAVSSNQSLLRARPR